MNPSTCSNCAESVVKLNAQIPEWAAELNTEESPITVVDCWTGFDTGADTGDGVHPNDVGIEKLAACWFGPVSDAVGA